jgi:CelD/BcsL family acetyltransferase involved in cellulose biosynthesis
LSVLGGRAAPILRAHLDDWRRLAAPVDPFVSPEWLALTGRLLSCGEPLVVAARRASELVAALALSRRGRTLTSLATDHTPRYDLVGDPAALPVLYHQLECDRSWDVVRLGCVPTDSPLAVNLPELARAQGCRVAVGAGPRSPYFALPGFEARLGGKFRGNLRRRARKLEGLSFERLGSYDAAALDEGLALEAAGWKGRAGTAIACDPRLRRFYHAVARTFGRLGQLTLAFLRAHGRRIAFHFALEDKRAYYLVKPGYDPDFAAFGPGQLLVLFAAADAERRGLVEFDFLGWDMDWKLEWTSRVRAHVTLSLYRPTIRGRLRHAAREVLRPQTAALVRRARTLCT